MGTLRGRRTSGRWSVKRDPNDKVGTAPDRESAIFIAQFYIDKLIKTRHRPTTPPKEVSSGEWIGRRAVPGFSLSLSSFAHTRGGPDRQVCRSLADKLRLNVRQSDL
jgi:hypothetical protein